ncbi:MAG: hypothetical protein PHS10_05840 [Thiovulaceae bacterium]|jgi:hypothetical protein|nr:hypothetical protein [Sulfurimonadaceae bacterium]
MTQQQMSKLLDLPQRTLRDWKHSRNRLYSLLLNLEYDDVKTKIGIVDISDTIEFDPSQFSVNLFWQTNTTSRQKVYAIISNYLGTLNREDIKILCQKFGKNMVKAVLEDKYKTMYKKGFLSTSGIDIPLCGPYNQSPIYKEILGIINDL